MADPPDRFAVELNGRKLMASHKDGQWRHESIPLQSEQIDTSGQPGEQSLSRDDLWRRSIESWHRGAGQSAFDRADSDPFRFRSSLGVDPWTKWQLGLLGETERKLASTATSLKLVVAGGYLYCADGQTLKYTQDVTGSGVATWTTVTGTPASTITGLASDGYTVWAAFGASGIYSTTRGAATASVYNNLNATTLDYVKGRLMVGYANGVYNVTGPSPDITFRATSTATGTGGSLVVPMPAGTLEGDVLLLIIAGDSASVVYPHSQFPDWTYVTSETNLTTGLVLGVFYKVAAAIEPSVTLTWTPTATTTRATVIAYDHAYEEASIDVAAAQVNAASANVVAPSVATTYINDLLVFVGATKANTTFTPPTGYTERSDQAATVSVEVADKLQAATGASGTATAVAGSSAGNIGIHLALRPNIPDPLFSHASTDFAWVGFAEGQGDVYAAGFAGDKSLVYKTQVRPDGTALETPAVAGSLPDGEIVRAIGGYLGFVFIGTDRGLRMAVSDANGDLTIGALIVTGEPVRCFEGQDRFVWFGMEDFDVSRWAAGTYDGLGRLDLTQQTSELVPAWASDLMVSTSTGTTEQVTSIATFQNVRVFAVADSGGASRGVYAEKATKVATGYLDSGLVTYGIPDPKVATYLDLRHRPLVGTIAVALSADEAAFVAIGTSSTVGSTKPAVFAAGPTRGDQFELRLTLTRASAADMVGPQAAKVTLRSEPAPSRGVLITVPLLLFENVPTHNDSEVTVDVAAVLAEIKALFAAQTLFSYKEYGQAYNVFLKDYRFVAEKPTEDLSTPQGVCLVQLKAPGQ